MGWGDACDIVSINLNWRQIFQKMNDYPVPSVICSMAQFKIWIAEDFEKLTKAWLVLYCKKSSSDPILSGGGVFGTTL